MPEGPPVLPDSGDISIESKEDFHAATFQYEAMNAAGQEVKAEIDAGTADEAIAKIRTQGYFPTKVKEKAAKKQKAQQPQPEWAASAATKRRASTSPSAASRPKPSPPSHASFRPSRMPACRSCGRGQFCGSSTRPGLLKNVLDGASGQRCGKRLNARRSDEPTPQGV